MQSEKLCIFISLKIKGFVISGAHIADNFFLDS